MRLKRQSRKTALLAITFGLLAMSPAHAGDLTFADALVQLREADDASDPMVERFGKLDEAHGELFGSRTSAVDDLTSQDAAAAFEAADLLAFYAQYGPAERLAHYVDEMHRWLAVLNARGAAGTKHATATFEALVSLRAFDRAQRLVDRFPEQLEGRTVPRVVFAPGFAADLPAVLALREDGALLARNVAREGDHVVVVVGCHLSQDALDAINRAPRIADAFARHATFWLLPADRMTDPAFLREWNARYPRQQAAFAYANAAWRNVDFASMPGFQRFDGERLVASAKGFPRDGDLSAVEALLGDPGTAPLTPTARTRTTPSRGARAAPPTPATTARPASSK